MIHFVLLFSQISKNINIHLNFYIDINASINEMFDSRPNEKSLLITQNRLLRIQALVVFGGVTSILMLHNNRARITMA